MMNLNENKAKYLIFGIICLVMLIIFISGRKFIKDALSEDSKPSSKRVGGFLLVIVVCFNEIFTTLKKGEFNYQHLLAILIAIMLCWGIATMPQLLDAWKGGGNKLPDPIPNDPAIDPAAQPGKTEKPA